jgi:hypothetical protein
LIDARAAEIAAELDGGMELDAMGEIALWALARQKAIVEAIDHELSDRGLLDRRGKERYLLKLRERSLRQLKEVTEGVLQAEARVRKHQMLDSASDVVGESVDYVRALQTIALGHEPDARASDRLVALKTLIDLGGKGTTSNFKPRSNVGLYDDDPEIGEEVAMLRDELKRAKKLAYVESLRRLIDATEAGYA